MYQRLKIRLIVLCMGGCLSGASYCATQTGTEQHLEYEQKIRELENRLAIVEGQLETLLKERSATAPAAVLAESSPRIMSPVAITPATKKEGFETPPELLPEIGKIGAEVGTLLAGAASPFQLNHGTFYGGYIDLPLIDRPAWLHGKISYEVMIGLTRSQTKVVSTSNVAQVANLAVLTTLAPNGGIQNINDALNGTGSAPFSVKTANELNLRLLQIVPFSLKYASTALDKWRMRPYGIVGFGTYVTIHSENATSSNSGLRSNANLSPAVLQALQQTFGNSSPFGTPLVAGQIGQSPELVARGLPGGNGSVEIGLQAGGGVAFRLSRTISLGFDGRYNRISGANGNFGTYGTRIGFHF